MKEWYVSRLRSCIFWYIILVLLFGSKCEINAFGIHVYINLLASLNILVGFITYALYFKSGMHEKIIKELEKD